MKQKQMKGVCLLIAGILFLLLFFSFSGIEKTKLLDTDGRNFEKAEVTNVISGNLSNSGSGKQTVELKLLSGDHKGKIIQATSSQSYLFGAKCKKGMKVIAIINESKGELLASVYSVNRGPMVWLMAAVFVAIVVAVGGRKGISSILSLVFTMLCIFFIFLFSLSSSSLLSKGRQKEKGRKTRSPFLERRMSTRAAFVFKSGCKGKNFKA